MLTLLRLCVCGIRTGYIYDDTPKTSTALLDRVRQHAADVAAEHFPDLPVETIAWEVSHRRQRSAGATKYDPANGEITISLAWAAFEQHGWEQFSSTVRHELIHAWQYHEFGDADHGSTFAQWRTASTLRSTASDSPPRSGGLFARTAAGGLAGIDAQRPFATQNSTDVVSAVGHSVSRRGSEITERQKSLVPCTPARCTSIPPKRLSVNK
ncbi:SprT-like domain-containing protein [Haladaptatus caseinilyticus]|uniref:SprT-like domain-containing protein n=1 Tax=Haladaptatus caseinilyticus TaxID=2993314 RepID=UPI00224B2802|nr:SprT-like domain-containing protein [Haladaptatus caseinilyticus]